MPLTRRHVPYGSIAAALYAISLALPAIIVIHKPLLWGAPHDEPMFGFQCLMIGWLTIPWYANLTLWVAALCLAFRRSGAAIVFSVTSIVLALSTVIYLGAEIRALHVGYFAWLASMILVLVASCAGGRDRGVGGRL